MSRSKGVGRVGGHRTAGLLHPIPADATLPAAKRSRLDRLYQSVTNPIDHLVRASASPSEKTGYIPPRTTAQLRDDIPERATRWRRESLCARVLYAVWPG